MKSIDNEEEDSIDFDDLNNLLDMNKPEKKEVVEKKVVERKLSCSELIDKVLNCSKCRKMLEKRLGRGNSIVNSILSDKNKELFLIILSGIFIIIVLDLFVRIGSNLTIRK